MIVKHSSRRVEIPPLRLSEVVPVGKQYGEGAKAAIHAAYALGAERGVAAVKSGIGKMLEDALMGDGRSAE